MRDLATILQPYDLLKQFIANPEKTRASAPMACERLIRLQQLYKSIEDKPDAEARRIIAEGLKNTAGSRLDHDDPYRALAEATKGAKDFIARLVHEFVPEALRFAFTSDGVTTPTNDPLRLLKIIWNTPGCSTYCSLRSFEAYRDWYLGKRYFLMRLLYQPLAAQLERLTLHLEEKFFSPPREDERKLIVTSHFDPQDLHRYSTKPNLPLFNHPVSCRIIKVNGKRIQTLYDGRIKAEEAIFRKIIHKEMAENPSTSDYCAFTLVFFSLEDYQAGLDKLREIFSDSEVITNIQIKGHGCRNQYSSGLAPPEMKFRVFWQGEWVEVQLMLYPDYFNRHFSLGPEMHHLYRLGQVIPMFSLFLPTALYDVDWEDPAIQQRLKNLQIARVRANFEPV